MKDCDTTLSQRGAERQFFGDKKIRVSDRVIKTCQKDNPILIGKYCNAKS